MQPKELTPSERRLAEFLLGRPAATAHEISLAFEESESSVSQKLGGLKVKQIVRRTSRKPYRHFLTKAGYEMFRSLTDQLKVPQRLASHVNRRFDESLSESFAASVKEDMLWPGVFDVMATIHAAVVMDEHLRIIAWSPAFQVLVSQTSPNLLDQLLTRNLRLLAGPNERKQSWLGGIRLRPFDWESGVARDTDACYSDDGIWQNLLVDGYVDAFSVQTFNSNDQPLYLEVFIASQRTFAGYQSLLLNVSSRVVSVKKSNASQAHYAFLTHELRQPLQTLRSITRLLERTTSNAEGDQKIRLAAISESLRDEVDRLHWDLESFPTQPNAQPSTTPILVHLWAAKADLERSLKRPISVTSETLDEDKGKFCVEAVPYILYQSLREFLINALKYGWSDRGVTIEYEETNPGELQIVISDYGPGLPASDIQRWNDEAEKKKSATVSDIDRFDGLNLAIMGVNSAGGNVSFVPTRETGLTVVMKFPVTEIQIHESA